MATQNPNNSLSDSGSVRSEHLLTDTSDSSHSTAQGDLAGEAHGWGHHAAREKRDEGEDDGDASRRTVLLDRPRGKVKLMVSLPFRHRSSRTHMDVVVAKRVVANAELGRVSLDPGHRELSRLLDDIAELTRQAQVALAVGDQSALDEQDASVARSHIGETGDNTGTAALLAYLVVILRHAEDALNIVDSDDRVVRGSAVTRGRVLDGLRATELCDLTLEGAHARLASVVVDDARKHIVVGGHTALAEAVLLRLLRKQEAAGDRELFVRDVAGALDDLATVKKRAGDRVEAVGSRDERDLTEIDSDVTEVVVVEGPVLGGVKRLKECSRGVAMVVGLADLVNLID